MTSFNESMEVIHRRLQDAGSRNASGEDWLCPVHEVGDGQVHAASLTVKRGDQPGKIVIACAKCDIGEVLERLGLTYADLHFDKDAPRVKTHKQIHNYPDADGGKFLQVSRQRWSSGKSDIRQSHWNGSCWKPGVGGKQRVLYNLPGLLKAISKGRTIHLTEGESDADALNAWFKTHKRKDFATCHPQGAGKWLGDYTQALAGAKRVVVWADRDSSGYACAAQRFSAAREAGHDVEIRLPIPDDVKADVRDHLNAGHTPDDGRVADITEIQSPPPPVPGDEQEDVRRAFARLVVQERAQLLHRAAKADAEFRVPPSDLNLATALQRERVPLTYTIDRLHPAGSNSLIAAQYKVGKTTLMANLLKAYADGDKFLGEFPVTPGEGKIALFNYELTEDMLLDEYLGPMGIERPDRVAVLNLRGMNFDLRSPAAFAWAAEWLRERGCDALILDPFGAAARLANENDNSETRNWLLGTLDPFKAAAGIRDLWMPAHTGRGQSEEGEEHARGASSVDDWADVRWNYTKDKATDENGTTWRRFISANGRAVDVPERELAFDTDDRSLYVSHYLNRAQSRATGGSALVVALVERTPGINATDLKATLTIGNRDKSSAITSATRAGLIHVQLGSRNAKHYYPGPEASDA